MKPGPREWNAEECPARHRHTYVPVGYVERAEDAERRLREGQEVRQCATCGLWAIWHTACGALAEGST